MRTEADIVSTIRLRRPDVQTGLAKVLWEKWRAWSHDLCEVECNSAGVWRDPLAHPAISAMSVRELGDLPFPRGRSS